MNTQPTDLQIVEDNALLIKWSDGQQRRYSFRELRDACPCDGHDTGIFSLDLLQQLGERVT